MEVQTIKDELRQVKLALTHRDAEINTLKLADSAIQQTILNDLIHYRTVVIPALVEEAVRRAETRFKRSYR